MSANKRLVCRKCGLEITAINDRYPNTWASNIDEYRIWNRILDPTTQPWLSLCPSSIETARKYPTYGFFIANNVGTGELHEPMDALSLLAYQASQMEES